MTDGQTVDMHSVDRYKVQGKLYKRT